MVVLLSAEGSNGCVLAHLLTTALEVDGRLLAHLLIAALKIHGRPSRCQTVANQAGASEIRTLQCMATQGQGKRMLSADQLWLMGCWAVDASTPDRLLRA